MLKSIDEILFMAVSINKKELLKTMREIEGVRV
jgi:hypothetical protein